MSDRTSRELVVDRGGKRRAAPALPVTPREPSVIAYRYCNDAERAILPPEGLCGVRTADQGSKARPGAGYRYDPPDDDVEVLGRLGSLRW